jgi:hypothetical protein
MTVWWKLKGAGGKDISVRGTAVCRISFHGLRVELCVVVCDLHVDAIMGNDALGTKLPHILDVKTGRLFASDGITLQLHRWDYAYMGRVFTRGHNHVPVYYVVQLGRREERHCLLA